LQRLYPVVADYLSETLDVKVVYEPVTDYAASVTGFKVGDLDLVWFGGLTGVQARAQVEGESVLAQRDVDTDFHTVFIANAKSGLRPVSGVAGLSELGGRRFTFGSESSTSGRLMPEYFLDQAGLTKDDFQGQPGFSGSHDTTIAVVESGAYEAGALNEQVWKDRLEEGAVDTSKVKLIWRSSGYHDYHWVGSPSLDERFGDGFTERLRDALLAIDGDNAREKKILELFGAGAFVPVGTDEHGEIEQTARQLGLLGKAGA
jgi:phosphonate transport system substrate-binding protein